MPPGSSRPRVPFITADQMREVDRVMVEEYGIQLVQMMENAGRGLARLAWCRFLDGAHGRSVLVLAGTGGNGGGGMVCARRLHAWGAKVHIWLAAEASGLTEAPRHQLAILERIGVLVQVAGDTVDLPPADLIVDALIGYSLQGAPKGVVAGLIRAANAHQAPILSLDVPSGVDATTGQPHDPSILAAATLTLALPKTGLRQSSAAPYVGELHLADISVPPQLYRAALGIEVGTVFAMDDIIRLW